MPHQPNPFSTRFIRPGAIPFHFNNDQNAHSLIAKLQSNHWQGEIIGPHGTGKSTLLEALIPELENQGRTIVLLKLTAPQPTLSWSQLFAGRWNAATQVIIDGYEQLGWLSRLILAHRRCLSGAGMLVTAHQSVGFPMLYQTTVNEQLAISLVEQLTQSSEVRIANEEVVQALQASHGNLRDTLFQLYDLYELRKSSRSY
jgi:ABC-type cobalamin/Fe3+-siderophores transport system ATPase subunit